MKDKLLLILSLFVLFIAIVIGVTAYSQISSRNKTIQQLAGDLQDIKDQLPAEQKTPSDTQPVTESDDVLVVEPTSTTPSGTDESVVSKEIVSYQNETYTFIHRCKGQIKKSEGYEASFEGTPFCIGENMLTVEGLKDATTLIVKTMVTKDEDAPVLLKAERVPNSPRVLVSYEVEGCTTIGDCGAGMPENYVTYVFNLGNNSFKTLTNFPLSGTPVWNAAGTKALFIISTCGGAGCETSPIVGYELLQDRTVSVTKQEGTDMSDGQSVDGKKVAWWKNVQWTDDTHFKATLVDINGNENIVQASF